MSDSSKPRMPKGPARDRADGVRVINDWARSGDATKRPEFQPGYKSPSPYKPRNPFARAFLKK